MIDFLVVQILLIGLFPDTCGGRMQGIAVPVPIKD